MAHCPLSNAYFSAKPFPLREALDLQVKVGLGSDVAGGYSLDIMNSMRQAVAVSRMREGERKLRPNEISPKDLSIDWKESLYLATRGGALALGLQGIFQVGAPFDAQESKRRLSSFWPCTELLNTFMLPFPSTTLRPCHKFGHWSTRLFRHRTRV